MSYRIPPGGDPASDIPALIAEQAEKAVAALLLADENPAEAIHAARQRFKKIRGALRLVRFASAQFYVRENARYRDLSRALSSLRDAAAHVETLDRLTDHYAELLAPHAFVGLRQELAGRAGELAGRDERIDLTETVIAESRQGKAALDMIDLPGAPEEMADLLERGLGKTYGQARKALSAVREMPSSEGFHDLRKAAKYHWMHVRLLQDIWPEPMQARRAEAKSLSDALGDLHDVFEFRDLLAGDELQGDHAREVDLLITLLNRRQSVLIEESLGMAAHLFAEKPHHYAGRVREHYLQAARTAAS
jgi:CHAD domain-containing protein